MNVRFTLMRSLVGRAMLLALAGSLLPSSAMAREANDTTKPVDLQAAMSSVINREYRTLPSAPGDRRLSPPSRVRTQDTNPATQSPAFFKTRTGIIALAVVAAGVGYAIYSTQHDRIHSPGKQ